MSSVEASTRTPEDELVDKLGAQLREPPYHLIHIDCPPQPPRLTPRQPSSVGTLDLFPTELLHSILNDLDFQTLCRFSQVSHLATSLVCSLRTYRCLMQHAPTALAALGRTRLIGYFSANKVLSALCQEKCISCGNFGGFLLLPICERVCLFCVRMNPALWMVPRNLAAHCFLLSESLVNELPSMLSLPGEDFFLTPGMCFKERMELVCVRDVKNLALSVHGPELHGLTTPEQSQMINQDLALFIYGSELYNFTEQQQVRVMNRSQSAHHLFLDAPTEPYNLDPHTWIKDGRKGRIAGVGRLCVAKTSIQFPSIMPTGVETGLRCRGCEGWSRAESYKLHRVARGLADLEETDLPIPKARALLNYADSLGYSREDLLKHVKVCPGVEKIAVELEVEHLLHPDTSDA